ncbi:MAG: DMT family transporter [Mesorhizobium sp.]|nr:MAG: DMT family transporter [Mesorhizobium sp.]
MLLMLCVYVCFTFLDTSSKYLVLAGVSALIVAWARFIVHVLLVGVFLRGWRAPSRFRARNLPAHILRGAFLFGSTMCNIFALRTLQLAETTSIYFFGPMVITALAGPLLGEWAGWRRWLAIAVGFAGVLVIVRPGFEGFSIYSLLALASVACCAVRDLSTRRIPQAIPTLLVSTATALAMTVLGAALLAPMGGWTPMSGKATALLALAAVLVLIGYQFIIMAMRSGDISFIAPFRYTALLWSILLGLVIFGDVPDLPMTLGAAIIVGSGLYALYRERIVGRRQTAAESAGPDMAPDGI